MGKKYFLASCAIFILMVASAVFGQADFNIVYTDRVLETTLSRLTFGAQPDPSIEFFGGRDGFGKQTVNLPAGVKANGLFFE